MTSTTHVHTILDLWRCGLHPLAALRLLPHVRQQFVLPCRDLGAVLGRMILASDILDDTFRINRNMASVYFHSFYLL